MVTTKLNGDFEQSSCYSQIRLVTQEDIPVIGDWWKCHRKDDFIPELLSTLGVMIEGKAAGFLYETNSCRCFADYCVVNPHLSKPQRAEAIKALMDALIGVATGRGFKVMEITVRNQPLMLQRCAERGFVELGDVKYLGKVLCLAS